jgi:hypothetical protein
VFCVAARVSARREGEKVWGCGRTKPREALSAEGAGVFKARGRAAGNLRSDSATQPFLIGVH